MLNKKVVFNHANSVYILCDRNQQLRKKRRTMDTCLIPLAYSENWKRLKQFPSKLAKKETLCSQMIYIENVPLNLSLNPIDFSEI